MIRTAVVAHAIDAAALLAEVTSDDTGASTLFVGTVRNLNDGRAVTGIEYTAYASMAAEELQRVAEDVAAQHPDIRIVIEHRVGTLQLRDISVAIAVAHARRAPAMEASRVAIEELKRRVPIWKREHYVEGDWHWVDPTTAYAQAPVA
jgi:molybdopterin synthase catalytic subunit